MKTQKAVKYIISLAVILLVTAGCGSPAMAWLQSAHTQINKAATSSFSSTYAKSSKYYNSAVNLDYFCDAPNVVGTNLFQYNQLWSYISAKEQIINGGFSADEPNVYVSVRHFYDPLALSGKNELTDQETMFGMAYTPIPATEWALWNEENPYCLRNAMLYYKKSMEIACDAQVSAIPAIDNFRDFAGSPKDLNEMRSMYLGKSMRGLGEVMHLVADMTQPAHVRNDSHPKTEMTEQAITEAVASALVKFPRLDNVNISASANHVYDIMLALSTYTNSHFYSEDTIADIASGVSPNNGEKPYSSPNFSQFTVQKLAGYDTYYSNFNGTKIPMVAMVPGWLYGVDYKITNEIAIMQGQVLVPLAVAANAQVMNMFFPTLKMEQQVQEVECNADILALAKQQGAEELKQYEAAIKLVHQIEKDSLWTGEGLEIRYSGPGQLWRTRNNRPEVLCEVEFLNGVLVSYQDGETGEMVEGNPVFYLPTGAEKQISLTGPIVDYTVEYGDAVFAVVNAGARIISSESYVFEQEEPEIELSASSDTILPGEKVSFVAEVKNPPERYKLEWSFGDEDAEKGELPIINRKTEMTHIYESGGDYTVTVKLIDTKRKITRCSDSVEVSSEMGEMEGSWNITLSVQEESQVFRSLIIGFMKGLIRYILSPISEALGGGPLDESSVESFTMVGTEIYYVLNLSQSEDDPAVYSGPLTYNGSNTNYIDAPDNLISLTMHIEKGYVTFDAQSYDEYGNYINTPFLTGGTMLSPGSIQGEYDFGGTISGIWTAEKN
ncbi:MAG: PKD domain-containing protein [Eubacteriales bacterium]